jgi:hypothetical protein
MTDRIVVYPRKPGSDTRVAEEQWVQSNSLGDCPACGSIGIEVFCIPGDTEMVFLCSDETCRDLRGHRTFWIVGKPQEFINREIHEGWSWNAEHFPGKNLIETCPD